jgi:hypothetical protein
MKHPVPQKADNFLTSIATIIFSRTVRHHVSFIMEITKKIDSEHLSGVYLENSNKALFQPCSKELCFPTVPIDNLVTPASSLVFAVLKAFSYTAMAV